MNEQLLKNDLLILNSVLIHSGRKGQQWGVFGASGATRYQNHAVYAKGAQRYASGANDRMSGDSQIPGSKNYDPRTINQNYEHVVKKSITDGLRKLPKGGRENLNGLAYDLKILALARFAEASEKMNNRRMSKLSIDEATGLHLKNKDYTPDVDMKYVNPAYNDLNTNTENNCVLCSITYELRRRGYDVTAEKAGNGYDDPYFKKLFPSAKVRVGNRSNLDTGKYYEKISKSLLAHGNSRGALTAWYDDAGHNISYEVSDGKLVFRDTQRNLKMTESMIKDLLENSNSYSYVRLDNVNFDTNTIKEAVR